MVRRLLVLMGLLLVTAAGIFTYQIARAGIAADLYRKRLSELATDYQNLKDRYNEAVARTAVTELRVAGTLLEVIIRTAAGVEKTIPTPFDPSKEVFVDYIVKDGRLWIRRIFDEGTAPEEGVVIDPLIADVDWNDPGVTFGKTIYRTLEEGNWIVTVSGDGSLAIQRREELPDDPLSPPPVVKAYDQLQKEVNEQMKEISVTDVFTHLFGGSD